MVGMKKTVLLLASMAAALALASGVAVAAEPYGTLDVNTLDAESNYSFRLYQEWGQTFVPEHSGQVTGVQLELYNAFPERETWDNLDIYIYSVSNPFEYQLADHGGMFWVRDVLSWGRATPGEVSATSAPVTVELAHPATVQAGHHYAIGAKQQVLGTYVWKAHHNGNVPSSDIYPEGMVLQGSSYEHMGGPFYLGRQIDTIFAVYVNQRPIVFDVAPAPGSIIRVRRPTIAATVNDPETDLSEANISLFMDGKPIRASTFTYDASTDRLTYQPATHLPSGKHTVKVVATDEGDFARTRQWRFEIR
jgi:hypothetical protein